MYLLGSNTSNTFQMLEIYFLSHHSFLQHQIPEGHFFEILFLGAFRFLVLEWNKYSSSLQMMKKRGVILTLLPILPDFTLHY